MASGGIREKALGVLKYLPRVSLSNIKDLPNSNFVKKKRVLGSRREIRWPQKGHKQRQGYARLGYEGGSTPFYIRTPHEPYNEGHHLRRSYPPLSLGDLQLMIDNNRIDASKPIDLTSICLTGLWRCDPVDRQFGFQLTIDGLDCFKARINIEIQHAKEPVIAAIERNGGVITTAFYDILSVEAKVSPKAFFGRGMAIPKRELPPEDAFAYYIDPKNRGYLADPKLIAEERLKLAQKYGYELVDLKEESSVEMRNMLTFRKDPRQLFEGLRPGWLVSLKDRQILKPTDPEYEKYYES